jgi:hypothetical protein
MGVDQLFVNAQVELNSSNAKTIIRHIRMHAAVNDDFYDNIDT